VLGWVLMTVAMMLPTALPVLSVFGRLIGERANAGRLMANVVGGYLLVWLGFGLAAHLIGIALVALVQRSVWLSFNGWAIGAALLLVAGLFQFSRL
jgi:predicted metal-binding membrane protein